MTSVYSSSVRAENYCLKIMDEVGRLTGYNMAKKGWGILLQSKAWVAFLEGIIMEPVEAVIVCLM